MKKIISIIAATILASVMCLAQNNKADNILGKYSAVQNGDGYKVQITKNADGTYKAQIYWVSDPVDPKTGKKNLDVKNPDKSLRNVPTDRIVLIDGLKYDAAAQQWGDTKIYDPQRGIRANCTVKFENAKVLKVSGKILGIGETATWTRID